MKYLNFKSQYDKYPSTKIENHKAIRGYSEIANELNNHIQNKNIIALEFYPGVNNKEVLENIESSYIIYNEENSHNPIGIRAGFPYVCS